MTQRRKQRYRGDSQSRAYVAELIARRGNRTPEQALQAAYAALVAQLPDDLAPAEYARRVALIARELGI